MALPCRHADSMSERDGYTVTYKCLKPRSVLRLHIITTRSEFESTTNCGRSGCVDLQRICESCDKVIYVLTCY